LVGSGREAEAGNGLGPRLVEATLVESERQTGHFGQPGRPVVPAGDDLLQFAHRGGRLRLGRLAPVSVPPGSARQAGYDQPGRVRAGTFVRLHD